VCFERKGSGSGAAADGREVYVTLLMRWSYLKAVMMMM
jgi:hypothetical protein